MYEAHTTFVTHISSYCESSQAVIAFSEPPLFIHNVYLAYCGSLWQEIGHHSNPLINEPIRVQFHYDTHEAIRYLAHKTVEFLESLFERFGARNPCLKTVNTRISRWGEQRIMATSVDSKLYSLARQPDFRKQKMSHLVSSFPSSSTTIQSSK